MLASRKMAWTIVLSCLLCACSTTHNNTAQQKEDKKIKTAQINTQLGISYLQRHQMELAKEKLLLALQQAPNIPDTWYSMAYYLEATGDTTQAKQYYLKALAISPKNGEAQNNYGTYLCRSGAYQESIQHFMSALEDPNYLDSASAYENAGLCALKIPDRQLAVRYFNRALLQDPNLPNSLIELAQFDYDKKNYASAREKLRQFLTIASPTDESRMLSAQLGEKLGYLKNTSDTSSSILTLRSPNEGTQWS